MSALPLVYHDGGRATCRMLSQWRQPIHNGGICIMPMVKQPLTIEHALLGFVRQRPMHGYEIHQRLLASAELGMVWSIKQSLLYAHLTRLEEEGLLTSQFILPTMKA